MSGDDDSQPCSHAWQRCSVVAARVSGNGTHAVPDGRISRDPPTPPAAASDVLEVLVAEGEKDGWLFTERSTTLAVGTKEIDGRPWMVSVAVRDDTVQQLFAGR